MGQECSRPWRILDDGGIQSNFCAVALRNVHRNVAADSSEGEGGLVSGDRKEAPPDKLEMIESLLSTLDEIARRNDRDYGLPLNGELHPEMVASVADFGREIAEQCAKIAQRFDPIRDHWGTCQDISDEIRNHFQLGAQK
jgi:hypothetical protein